MKSMLKQALLVASMFVVPAMVAADAKPAVETATSNPKWYSTAWSKTKSGANTALQATKSAGKKAGNFVADYTVRTSAAKKIGSLFLTKDGNVSKVKVGAAVAGYAGIAAATYYTVANADKNSPWYKKAAKWATSPFWGSIHLGMKVKTWAFPTAIVKAEKVVAKAEKAVATAEKNGKPEQVAAAKKALAEAKVAVAQVRFEAVQAERNALVKAGKDATEADKAVAKAEAELNAAKAALQPAPAAAPAAPAVTEQPAPAATPAQQPAPAAPAQREVVIERKVVVEQTVPATSVKSTPVVDKSANLEAAKAQLKAVQDEMAAIRSRGTNGEAELCKRAGEFKNKLGNAQKAVAAAAGK